MPKLMLSNRCIFYTILYKRYMPLSFFWILEVFPDFDSWCIFHIILYEKYIPLSIFRLQFLRRGTSIFSFLSSKHLTYLLQAPCFLFDRISESVSLNTCYVDYITLDISNLPFPVAMRLTCYTPLFFCPNIEFQISGDWLCWKGLSDRRDYFSTAAISR